MNCSGWTCSEIALAAIKDRPQWAQVLSQIGVFCRTYRTRHLCGSHGANEVANVLEDAESQ